MQITVLDPQCHAKDAARRYDYGGQGEATAQEGMINLLVGSR